MLLSEQTDYLSPALALRCVELQTQESSSDHAEPVDVHHVLGILSIMAKDTGTETETETKVNLLHSHQPRIMMTSLQRNYLKLYEYTDQA